MDSFAPNMESMINRYHPGFLSMIADNHADDLKRVQHITMRYNQKKNISTKVSLNFTALYLLISRWRIHRAIYRFNPNLWNALVEQASDVSDTEVLPSEFILHLPYECIQVEGAPVEIVLDSLGLRPIKYYGSFLTSIMQPGTLDPEYPCLYMIWEKDGRKGTEDFYLPIVPGQTILDCYHRLRSTVNDDLIHQQSCVAMTRIAIQFILYLVAVNADIEEIPAVEEVSSLQDKSLESIKTVKKIRHKSSHSRIKKNQMYNVGYFVGPKLIPSIATDTGETGITLRPHIRRGHWQHYWKGPRDGERERVLKWKNPIFVKGDQNDLPNLIKVQ